MILASLAAALGLVLFLSGLPLARRDSLARRVEPYLSGVSKGSPGARATLLRFLTAAEGAETQARLEAAGLTPDVEAFRLQRLIWTVGGVGASVVVSLILGGVFRGFDPIASIVLAALGGAVGYLGRDRYLALQIERRVDTLREELPVALDLLTLAIMSGDSVPAAFRRTSAAVGGEIGRHFEAVVADVRAGSSTAEALEALTRRVPEPRVARLVDALLTALARGAPLAEILRAQADDHREERRRHLLELGGRREVLMLVPVVFLILPVIVLFALYPGLVALDLLVP